MGQRAQVQALSGAQGGGAIERRGIWPPVRSLGLTFQDAVEEARLEGDAGTRKALSPAFPGNVHKM